MYSKGIVTSIKAAATQQAKTLRLSSTPAERTLWKALSAKRLDGIKFRRQQPIGAYIVDFVTFDKKLIVEIDGGHHDQETVKQHDQERTQWLE